MSGHPGARVRTPYVLGAVSAVALLGSAGSAQAAFLSCYVNSGNPFLHGFALGVTPSGAAECLVDLGGADFIIAPPAPLNPGQPLLYAGLMGVTGVGNVIVPVGGLVASLGIDAGPAAVQGQIVAFNLAHGLPAAVLDLAGLEIVQSTLSGQVINNGTITQQPRALGFPQFAGQVDPSFYGLWVNGTTFTGAAAGIVNSSTGSITAGSGNFPVAGINDVPRVITGIRLDPLAGNFGGILNNGLVTATSNFAIAAATPAGAIGIELTAPAAGTATGTVINTSTVTAQGTGNFPQAFGIQIGGATTGVGGNAPPPNGGTLIGDINNTGVLAPSVVGDANGNAGAGATGIRVNLATSGTGGSPGVFMGNVLNLNPGSINVTANGAGLFAHGIEIGTATANSGVMLGHVTNSGSLSATGSNGATGVGIVVFSPVTGGILNTGTLFGSTSALDLTQEVGGSTNIVQAGGTMTGNILGSGNDSLSLTGGSLVLASAGVVNGLASFTTGPAGTLSLQVTPTQAAQITATTATLNGGTVQAVVQPGNFAPSTKYTILTASGGVTGTFANATSNSAFVTPTLSFDPQHAFLTLAFSGFTSVAQTPNQTNVGNALNASPIASPLVAAVFNQSTAAGARAALDALSGEIHASVQTSLLNDSLFGREALLARLRQASLAGAPGPMGMLGAGGPQVVQAGTYPQMPSAYNDALGPMGTLGVGGGGLAYADTAGRYDVAADIPGARPDLPVKAAPAGSPDWTSWAQGIGAWGRIGGDGNAADARDRLAGLFTGIDHVFGNNWRAGFASGFTNSSLSVDARASSASIDTAHFGAYAGTNWGDISFRSGADVTWSMIGTSRSIMFPGLADSTSVRYEASTGQVFGEIGEAKAFGNLAVEPFLGLAYVHLHSGGFTEAGGPAALAGSSADENVGDVSLGARLATNVTLSNGSMLVPHATAYWQHAIGNVTPNAALTFLSTGASFTVAGAPLARDAVVVDAGYDVWLSRQAKVGLSYFGQLAPHLQDHAAKGTFTWMY